MPRNLTAPQLAAIQNQVTSYFYLVSIETSASTRYFSTGSEDMLYNGDNYLATGDVIDISPYEEEQSISNNLKRVVLSGANQANYNLMLTEFSSSRPLKIFLTLNYAAIIPLFDGVISSMQIGDEGDLEIECQNKWSDTNSSGRVHSVSSQQRFYPSDLGFSMNKGLEDAKIEWGRGVE